MRARRRSHVNDADPGGAGGAQHATEVLVASSSSRPAAIAAGSRGSTSTAASPATSGSDETFEVSTGTSPRTPRAPGTRTPRRATDTRGPRRRRAAPACSLSRDVAGPTTRVAPSPPAGPRSPAPPPRLPGPTAPAARDHERCVAGRIMPNARTSVSRFFRGSRPPRNSTYGPSMPWRRRTSLPLRGRRRNASASVPWWTTSIVGVHPVEPRRRSSRVATRRHDHRRRAAEPADEPAAPPRCECGARLGEQIEREVVDDEHDAAAIRRGRREEVRRQDESARPASHSSRGKPVRHDERLEDASGIRVARSEGGATPGKRGRSGRPRGCPGTTRRSRRPARPPAGAGRCCAA